MDRPLVAGEVLFDRRRGIRTKLHPAAGEIAAHLKAQASAHRVVGHRSRR